MDRPSVFEELLIVELASVLAGPAVGMFFAEMGSRVIKVENPGTGGDVTRSWRGLGESLASPGAYFSAANWGKESIAVDLRDPQGQGVVHDLVRRADVVIVSYKTGDAERLRVDWGTLSGLNPRLVYAEITAYGEGDPRVGYDAVMQAETGFASINGTKESGPLKMPVALIDLLAAHQLKEGVLAALLDRGSSGSGHRVSVSLFDAGVTALANQASSFLMMGAVPDRLGSAHPNIAPYGTSYRCRDGGFIVLAVGTDSQFRRLCRCLQDESLSADRSFATNEARVRNRQELEARLSDRIRRLDREDLIRRLGKVGVPCGAVRDVGEAITNPRSVPLVLSDVGGASAVRTAAFGIDGRPAADLKRPPACSEHARRLLADLLGYSEDRIERLARAGVVQLHDTGGVHD